MKISIRLNALKMVFHPMSLLLLITVVQPATAVWINLVPPQVKCVSEELQPNVVVVADYFLMYNNETHDIQTISAKVLSPMGSTLQENQNVSIGQFAFSTTETGSYLACFWLDQNDKGEEVSINLEWKVGIAAKNWDSFAKKEHIEGIELELAKLEENVRTIQDKMVASIYREWSMREVSEATNTMVLVLSLTSIGVCIVVSLWQTWRLKDYFQKKKII